MADIMEAYWRAPAIARSVLPLPMRATSHALHETGSDMTTRRTFATCVLVTSIACHMGIAPYSWIYFHYLELFRLPPQIWRPVTSFFLTSPQLGIVMDTYFVFQYASQLETAHPKFGRKEDFLWYLVFCGTVIIVRLPRQTLDPFHSVFAITPTAHLLYLPG